MSQRVEAIAKEGPDQQHRLDISSTVHEYNESGDITQTESRTAALKYLEETAGNRRLNPNEAKATVESYHRLIEEVVSPGTGGTSEESQVEAALKAGMTDEVISEHNKKQESAETSQPAANAAASAQPKPEQAPASAKPAEPASPASPAALSQQQQQKLNEVVNALPHPKIQDGALLVSDAHNSELESARNSYVEQCQSPDTPYFGRPKPLYDAGTNSSNSFSIGDLKANNTSDEQTAKTIAANLQWIATNRNAEYPELAEQLTRVAELQPDPSKFNLTSDYLNALEAAYQNFITTTITLGENGDLAKYTGLDREAFKALQANESLKLTPEKVNMAAVYMLDATSNSNVDTSGKLEGFKEAHQEFKVNAALIGAVVASRRETSTTPEAEREASELAIDTERRSSHDQALLNVDRGNLESALDEMDPNSTYNGTTIENNDQALVLALVLSDIAVKEGLSQLEPRLERVDKINTGGGTRSPYGEGNGSQATQTPVQVDELLTMMGNYGQKGNLERDRLTATINGLMVNISGIPYSGKPNDEREAQVFSPQVIAKVNDLLKEHGYGYLSIRGDSLFSTNSNSNPTITSSDPSRTLRQIGGDALNGIYPAEGTTI
jgi:hypothetical protein